MIRRRNYKITALILANLLLFPIAKEVYASDYLKITSLSANPSTISQGGSSTIAISLREHIDWGGWWGGIGWTEKPTVEINIAGRTLYPTLTWSNIGPVGIEWYYIPFWGWTIGCYYQDSWWRFETVWDGKDKNGNFVGPGEHTYKVSAIFPFGLDSKEAKITITAPAITIDVEATPEEAKPGQGSLITVTVKDGANEPVPGILIDLKTETKDKSGGHNHNTTRPVGKFSQTSGNTDSNGKFQTTYTASNFGGIEVIKASSADPPAEGKYELTVRVPGLVQLPPDPYYQLKQPTSLHPSPYWGTLIVVLSTKEIGKKYINLFPNDPLLVITDMSLEWGGLFDINGNWRPPHETHREGKDVDVRRWNIPVENRPDFVSFCKKMGAKATPHPRSKPTHYHLDF